MLYLPWVWRQHNVHEEQQTEVHVAYLACGTVYVQYINNLCQNDESLVFYSSCVADMEWKHETSYYYHEFVAKWFV